MPVVKSQTKQNQIDTTGLYRIPVAFGLCLLVVTLANLALVWSSRQFEAVQWELAVTSGTFERVPLLLLALMLIGGGFVLGKSGLATKVTGWVFLATGGFVAAVAILYALAAVSAVNALPEDMARQLKLSAFKNAVNSAAYIVTCVAVGVLLIRSVRREPARVRRPAQQPEESAFYPESPGTPADSIAVTGQS